MSIKIKNLKVVSNNGSVSCGCCNPIISNCCPLTPYGAANGQYSLSNLPHHFIITWEQIGDWIWSEYWDCDTGEPPFEPRTATFTRSGTTYTLSSGSGDSGVWEVRLYEEARLYWATFGEFSDYYEGLRDCFDVATPTGSAWWGDYCSGGAWKRNWQIQYYNADGSVWQYPSFPLSGWPTTLNFEWCSLLCEEGGEGCSGNATTTTTITSTNGVTWTGSGSSDCHGDYSVTVTCLLYGFEAKVEITSTGTSGLPVGTNCGGPCDTIGNLPVGNYYSGCMGGIYIS